MRLPFLAVALMALAACADSSTGPESDAARSVQPPGNINKPPQAPSGWEYECAQYYDPYLAPCKRINGCWICGGG